MQGNSHTDDSRGFRFFKWVNDYQLRYKDNNTDNVYTIEKVKRDLDNHKMFKINISMDNGQYDHCFELDIEDANKWGSVNLFVDDLISWIGKDSTNFHFIRQFLIDAQLIVENWLGIEDVDKKWTNTLSDQLLVLQSLIQFLETSPASIPELKDVAKGLIQSYYTLACNDTGKSDEIEHKQLATEKYLRLCIDDSNQEWFDLHSQARSKKRPKTREEEVADVARKLLKKDYRKNFAKRKLWLLEKAQSWLLLRYNLWEASKIAFNRQAWWHRLIFMAMPECLFAIVLLWLLFGPIKPIEFYDKNWFLFIFYLVGSVGALVWVVCVSKNEWKRFLGGLDKNVQLFLPRLAAGIIVGYLVLFNDEPWRCVFENVLHFSGKDGIWPAVARVILPLLGVLVYVYIETNKMTGHKISWKPIVVFLRGCAYSALIGVVVSDVFGASMAKHHHALPAFQGFFGTIYPKIIFCHAPLALFIGVFLQLLWEDKTLTEKI